MELSPIIARFEGEAAAKSAGSGDPIWDAIFYGIGQLKAANGDYDKAYAGYSLIMRVLIDSGPIATDDMPSLEALGRAMDRWRRERNIEARRGKQ